MLSYRPWLVLTRQKILLNCTFRNLMNLFWGAVHQTTPKIPIFPSLFSSLNTFANNPKIWGRFAVALAKVISWRKVWQIVAGHGPPTISLMTLFVPIALIHTLILRCHHNQGYFQVYHGLSHPLNPELNQRWPPCWSGFIHIIFLMTTRTDWTRINRIWSPISNGVGLELRQVMLDIPVMYIWILLQVNMLSMHAQL